MGTARRPFDRTIGIAFLGFIALGLQGGLLGLAWPSIQTEFALRPSAVGIFLLVDTIAFSLVSLNSGALVRRFGVGPLLAVAFLLRGGALFGIMLAPSWPMIIGLGLLAGGSGGAIDTGLNIHVARYNSTRFLNWLHACFGLGTMIGPLVMTALFASGLSWRLGYGGAGVFTAVIAVPFVLSRHYWSRYALPESEEEGGSAPLLKSLRLPLAWVSVAIFLVYAGLEVGTGQWAYSLFTAARAIDPTTAGLWVSVYWGAFTFGRFIFGAAGDRLSNSAQLRISIGLALVAVTMLWVNPVDLVGLVGLGLLGFALAPAFPVLIATTADRVGGKHAANVIGMQMGAAGLGVGLLPGLGGLLVEWNGRSVLRQMTAELAPINTGALTYDPGMAIIAPYLFVLAVIFAALVVIGSVWHIRQNGSGRAEAAPVPATEAASI
ncbi:MAG: MFS transporter [Chloroflexota bacterium]